MKNYILVGASKGIGREFIKKAIKKNVTIFLISRTNIDIESSKIVHIKTDLNNTQDLKNSLEIIIKRCNSIDSIGFFQKYRPIDKTKYRLEEDIAINIKATKYIIETLSEYFNDHGLKSIVVIGSIASKFVAIEQPVDYHIVKSALIGLVNYFAVLLAKQKIRVNMVSPSTTIKDENKIFYLENKNLTQLYEEISPLGSIVQSKDVVNLVHYLLSNKSKSVTGQNIIIDGGISLQWQEALGRELLNLTNTKITQ